MLITTRFLCLTTAFVSSGSSVFAQCPLCYDGSEPAGDLSVSPGGFNGTTCGELLAMAKAAEANSSACEDFLNDGFFCGCPVPDDRCPLCFDKSLPPNFTLMPYAALGLNGTCQDQVGMAALDFVSNEPAPGTMTCSEWLEHGVFCDCPLPEDHCNICEDGSELPNPDTMLGVVSCAYMAKGAPFKQGDECTAVQATIGVYCGCTNPQASKGFCRICGGNTLLPQPGLIAEDFWVGITCAEKEANLENYSCQELQSNYSSICCVNSTTAPGVAPTKAPGVAPTKAPGVAPTKAPGVTPTKAPGVTPTKAPTSGNSGAVMRACSPICVLLSAILFVLF